MKYPSYSSTPLVNVKNLLLLLIPAFILSCKKQTKGSEGTTNDFPTAHLKDVPELSGMLDRSKIVMTSAIQVDLDRDVATIPLYKGYYNGKNT